VTIQINIFCTVKQRDAEGKNVFPQQVMRTEEGVEILGFHPSFDIGYN
jgi:hypothetical protein